MRVVQISDTHVPELPGDPTFLGQYCGVRLADPAENLARILESVAGEGADLVVATGDLADRGAAGSYHRLRDLFSVLDVPVYALPGNHDLPEVLDAELPGGNVHVADHLGADGWTFLFARSGNTEWGEMPVAEQDRVVAAADAAGGDHVFLWVHHPPARAPVPGVPRNMQTGFMEADVLAVRERVPALRAVAAGHVHSAGGTSLAGIGTFTAPSTHLGTPAPGYLVYDLEPDGSLRMQIRAFPELVDLDEERRAKLRGLLAERASHHGEPARGPDAQAAARAEVLSWQDLVVDWRTNPGR